MWIAAVIILAVLCGVHFYLAQGVYQGLHVFIPGIRFWTVAVFFGIMTAMLILGFARSSLPVSGGIKSVLGVISAYWMGIFVYLLLFTVLADTVGLLLRVCRCPWVHRPAYRGLSFVLVAVLTFSTVAYGMNHVRQLQHVSYNIQLENKAAGEEWKIVLISDLHLGAVGSEERLEGIVREINGQEPDLICIAGDLFDTDFGSIKDPEKAAETLKQLRAAYGVYACMGNHDAGSTVGQMQRFLESCNIRALNEAYVAIEDRLILVGRLDASPIGGFGGMGRKELSEFFVREDPSVPVIVLEHNPAHVDTYTQEADLILSGHTHRGQIFPGSLVTDRLYAVDYGYYRKDGNSPHVIVTSGVGYWGLPMRVGTDCEIVTIKLST